MQDRNGQTYDLSLLQQSASTWKQSPSLRAIYERLYQRAQLLARPGDTLEVGSGIGVITEFWPDVVTSDIAHTEYVNRAASAYALENTGQWDNIVALDVLHHLCEPFSFFASASRALRDHGRLIIIEPAATPIARYLYHYLHHEPCDPSQLHPPFEFSTDDKGEFANMGMGQVIFKHHQSWTANQCREIGLKVVHMEHHDFLAYFLTGGFSRRLPTPLPIIKGILQIEALLPQTIYRLLATRMTLALEKV